jgi:hypothetical protein
MPILLERPPAAGESQRIPLRLSAAARPRRPALAAASVLLVALCVAVFAGAYIHAGERVPALEVVRPVAAGQRLSASDLASVSVAVPASLPTVPVAEAARVIGQIAAVPLAPGSLLAPGDVGRVAAPPPGEAVVGVSAAPAGLPAGGVSVGASVEVVLTGPPGSPDTAGAGATGATGAGGAPVLGSASPGASAGTSAGSSGASPGGVGSVLVPSARVVAFAAPAAASGSSRLVLSLQVPAVLAPMVATASAAGQVALVLVGPAA